MIAPSRAPVSKVKAMSARFRSSIGDPAGIKDRTSLISSTVATGRSLLAEAIRKSWSDGVKYAASFGLTFERKPGSRDNHRKKLRRCFNVAAIVAELSGLPAGPSGV